MRPVRPQGANDREVNINEPAAIRNLSKKQLHTNLKDEYYLPDYNSRGFNRNYLVGVYTGDHYRIEIMAFKHFQADLTPAQQKKAPVLYCSQLVDKIDRLLVETGRPRLGFDPGIVPEESWLLGVARYIDRANLLGVFMEPILQVNAPVPCMSQDMLTAKRNAEEFLLGGQNLLANTSIYKQVEGVHQLSKRLSGHRKELLALVAQGQALEQKVNAEQSDLNDRLYKVAVSIFTHGNRLDNPAEIFMEDAGPQHRMQIAEIVELLKFIYISDPVLDRSETARNLCIRFAQQANNQNAPPANH